MTISDSQKVSAFRDVPPSSLEPMSPALPEQQRMSRAAGFDRLIEVNLALTASVTKLVRVLWLSIGAGAAIEIIHFFVKP